MTAKAGRARIVQRFLEQNLYLCLESFAVRRKRRNVLGGTIMLNTCTLSLCSLLMAGSAYLRKRGQESNLSADIVLTIV